MANRNRAVLIDRDGTMAQKVAGNGAGFQLLPTVAAGIKLFNRHDIKVIMITGLLPVSGNSGEVEAPDDDHERLFSEIALDNACVDIVYHYPHLNTTGFSGRELRMAGLKQTMHEWDVDTAASYFIGDTFKDMEMTDHIGCGGVMVPVNTPEFDLLGFPLGISQYTPDVRCVNRDTHQKRGA
jgi:histidinol phosphatase-like enzyme